jgi:N-acetylmuramoyl-L-alanine amidase
LGQHNFLEVISARVFESHRLDPNMLAAWGARGATADVAISRSLYGRALAGGMEDARARLKVLEADASGRETKATTPVAPSSKDTFASAPSVYGGTPMPRVVIAGESGQSKAIRDPGFHVGTGPDDDVLRGASPQLSQGTAAPTIPTAPLRTLHRRFVLQLERPVDFQVTALSEPSSSIIVDLPVVGVTLWPEEIALSTARLIQSSHSDLSEGGKIRFVIDLSEPVEIERTQLIKEGLGKNWLVINVSALDPWTLPTAPESSTKVEIVSLERLGLLRSEPGAEELQPMLPSRAQRSSDRAFKPMIVIDPGHGGQDSGTIENGITEKDAVLSFGRALRDKLTARDRYNVLLTRDTDVSMTPDDRRAFGEEHKHKAQLFITLHAHDAASSVRGAAVYSLSGATADALRRSVQSEARKNILRTIGEDVLRDAVDAAGGAESDLPAVKSILGDLAERDIVVTRERTSVFVLSLIEAMRGSTEVRKNPDREADLRVLKSANVPSIMIDLGNVANEQDAENLKSDAWRSKVSDSIAAAIDNYFEKQIARIPM